jgi:hypothetical protein
MKIIRRTVVSTTLSEQETKALENWCNEDDLTIAGALKTALQFTLRNKHLLKEMQP